MNTKKEPTTGIFRKYYTTQFKERALGRADRESVPKVAHDLGLEETKLYSCKAKRQ